MNVKIFTRPTVGDTRKWVPANRREYPLNTAFYLRWMPSVGTNYKYESLGEVGFKIAQVLRAEKEVKLLQEPKDSAPATKPQTLEEFRTAFLHDKQTTRKKDGSPLDADTIRAYEQVTAGFILITKRTFPAQVTRQDLRDWIAEQRKTVCHRTVCNLYIQIACFLRFCGVDHKDLLPQNERPSPVAETPECYSEEEMTKFFFGIVDERDSLAFEFLLKTGAREKEMAQLEWSCLRLSGQPTVTFLTREGKGIKNGKSRVLPLERTLATKLAAWRKKNPTATLVFPTDAGKVEGHFHRICIAIAKRAGLDPKKFWLHKFRDTFATRSLRRGADIRTVQHWLGHASITETQKYLAPEEGKAAQSLMNAVFAEDTRLAAGA